MASPDVDAAYVRTPARRGSAQGETERFLFYRGLGRAAMPLQASLSEGGTLAWRADAPGGAQHLFVLRVENGRGVYRYLPGLSPGRSIANVLPAMRDAQPLPAFPRQVGDDLAARLTETGLTPKEARAMVNTAPI